MDIHAQPNLVSRVGRGSPVFEVLHVLDLLALNRQVEGLKSGMVVETSVNGAFDKIPGDGLFRLDTQGSLITV